ncbi:MAG: hypothetical protein P9X24_11270 [Candidatus Hatepunaea meridiana]|nr:hypothetical protein [Candidatus Hatepunaea meridiana]
MSILAQCGYGRGQKIEKGIDAGLIDGVIMSPRDERRQRLESDIQTWREAYPDAMILFDPQFYASKFTNPRDGHLSEYEYYKNNSGLKRTHFSPSLIQKYVKECLDYQINILGENPEYLISPSISIDDFYDHWSQIAINLAIESADYHSSLNNPPPLLISIVVSETAFRSLPSVEEFLDILTELEVEGFYLLIKRDANYLVHAYEPTAYSNILYFCYILSVINGYKIISGYSDWHSFLLHTVGVNYTACGWYQNLRYFSLARFQPSTGGTRPRKRYSSIPLLSNPLINPEFNSIFISGYIQNALSESNYDYILLNGPISGEGNWSDEISCFAHWYSLKTIVERIESHALVADRIIEANLIIQSAQQLYLQLENAGINFDPSTGPNHLDEWLSGLNEFRGIAHL